MDNTTDTRHTSTSSARARSARARRLPRVGSIPRSSSSSGWAARFAHDADKLTTAQTRWFASVIALAALAVLAQAMIAGEFNSHPGNSGWVSAHGLISYVTLGATLSAAIFSIVKLRKSQRMLAILAGGLFALTVAQTIIGYLITAGGQVELLVIHIPLAFVIFGITGWLALKATAISAATRSAADSH